jgi:hypothetical protein
MLRPAIASGFVPGLALLALAAATPAVALDLPPLCRAMHGLADAARQTHEAQRLAIADGGSAGAVSCQGASPAAKAFCDAAGAAVGSDGADMVPWRLFECVDNLGAEPQRTFVPGDVGPNHRQRMTHLAAGLGHGVRLDISRGQERYDLVVWSAP